MSDTSSSGDFPDSDDSSWEDDVLDLYEGGEPLWSRWILCHAHFQIERNVKTFVMYPLAGKKIKSINRRAEEREDHWRAEMVFLGYRYQLFLHAVSPVIGPWPLKNASYCIRQVKVPRDIYDAAPDRTKITGRLQKLRAWWPHPKRKILENALKRQNLPPTINKMVCFGVGAGVDSRSADWTEHEGAATIHMTIQGQLPRPVRLLSHYINDTEPPPDTLTFLEKMGFETVGRDGVGGFLEVDRNTVVFSVNPHQPVKQVLAELTRPAVIITHTFRRSDLEWSPPIKDIGDFHGNG
ncbi:hypothetical protein F4802DRAFT_349761 [Xylaria palmicola]|nr:hypothetical protein F4802DRAFT_349761 [Xylaria palmicola]